MKGLRLIATGGALPGRTVTNEELSRTVDTSDEWITTRTGIRTRHYCTEGENAATLAIAAAKQALQRSGLAPADIACCVCATLSAPDATPSVACQVQAALALPENRPALDVNAACSGFLYGTAVARGLLATLGGRYALVIGTEALSRLMDPADRSTCVLFGDGAGAAVVGEVEEGYGVLGIDMGADGNGGKHLFQPAGGSRKPASPETVANNEHTIHMNGSEVFKFAIQIMGKTAKKALANAGMKPEELDMLFPHQANLRIITSAAKRLKMPMEKVWVNVDKYANTSAASIPIALCEAQAAGKLKKGDNIILDGFGAGLTWAAIVLKWSK